MLKRYLSAVLIAVLSLTVIFSVPVVYADDSVYLDESFNGYLTGDIPHTALEARAIGDSLVSVCDTPSEADKSVHISCNGGSSSAFLQYAFVSPRKDTVAVDFDIYIPSTTHSITLPVIVDSLKTAVSVFEITNGTVMAGGIAASTLEQKAWNNICVEINAESAVFNLVVNGDSANMFTGKVSGTADIAKIRFEAKNNTSFYIDNILVSKGKSIKSSASDIPPVTTYSETSPIILKAEKQAVFADMTRGRTVLYAGSPYVVVNGTKHMFSSADSSVTAVASGGDVLVPLRFMAETYGYSVLWEEKTNSTVIAKDTKSARFTAGSLEVDNNGVIIDAPTRTIVKSGTTLVSVTALSQIFEQDLHLYDKLVVLGEGNPFETNEMLLLKQELINSVKYMRPEAKDMVGRLNASHPRVLASKADFDRIKSLVATDDFAQKMYNYIKTTADSYLKTTPAEYSLVEVYRMGDCSVVAPNRITALSFMWQVSGNEDYAVRCAEELQAICDYPDWNQSRHYLDTGVMLGAAAIGYDWMYDYLEKNNTELLATLRQKILDYGLLEGIEIHKGTTQYKSVNLVSSWPTSPYNWNPVCNSGIIMAALAIGDEIDASVLGTALELSLRSFEYICNEFAPDGAWEEGPGYWNGTVEYFVYVLNALETALGSDFGYSNAEGIMETCYYPVYIMGPAGTFNYSDSATTLNVESPHQFYWSNKLGDKNLSYLRKKQISKNNYRCEYTDLLWYHPENCADTEAQYEFDKVFKEAETATMRSDWDTNALFLGFHSGNSAFGAHAHLDTGTFVLDQNGIRWFEDLGTDRVSYTSASGFTAYAKRAEGHNTLVMQSPDIFETQKDDEGNLALLKTTFDGFTEGDAPVGVDITTGGSGKVYITQDDQGDDMHLVLSADDSETTTQSYIQKSYKNNPITNRMIIKYKVMREDYNKDISIPSLRSNENSVGMLVMAKSGNMRVYDGSESVTLRQYETGKWYDVVMDIDLKNQTYDLTITDELGDSVSADGYKLRSELDAITLFRIQLYAQTTHLHIDDFEIWVDPANEILTTRKELNDQNPTAFCYVDEFETASKGAFAVSDITAAYRDWASSAVRGAGLFDNRRVAVIRDEVKLKDAYDLYWFAHTKADIKVSEDGKSAILEKDGKRLWAGIIDGTDGKFIVMDAKPFATSPDPSGQTDWNASYKKLAIFLDDVTEANISVAFTSLADGQSAPETIPSAGTIASWSVPSGDIPRPDAITANGELLEGFNPNVSSYAYYVMPGDAVPFIDATASNGTVVVTQAQSIPGTATITVTDASGNSADYYVHIYEKIINYSTIDGHLINTELVSASSEPESHNPAVATLDGSLETAWASNGMAEWIMYDLGESKPIDTIQLAWRKGDSRVYNFEIMLSDDGASWTPVYEGKSSGTTLELEPHTFAETYGRFIRIVCYGSNSNTWNNITEIR